MRIKRRRKISVDRNINKIEQVKYSVTIFKDRGDQNYKHDKQMDNVDV